jgi:glucan-binding YG repeat protein
MKLNKIILIIILLSFLSFGSGEADKSIIMTPLEPYSISDNAGLSLSQSSLPYSKTGTINENGDEYWDNNEIDIIRYVIPSGETFEIELIAPSNAELWVFYGDFDGFDDVEEALQDIIDYGDSNRLLAWAFTVDGYATFDYNPGSKTDKNIAIFSYSLNNPSSMSYTLYSSIEAYSASSGSSDSNTLVTIVIIAGVVLIVFLIYRSSKKSKEPKYKPQAQYAQQPGYQQSYQPSQQEYQQQPPTQPTYQQSEPSKPEYQSQTPSRYCENCGSENMGAAMYCTTCGQRIS